MSLGVAREYLDLVKFGHTLFALPFALLGAALAAWGPDGWRGRVQDWVGILLCMATARTAAMAFNRLVDRDYDAQNPRTAGRHLPLQQADGRPFRTGPHAWHRDTSRRTDSALDN